MSFECKKVNPFDAIAISKTWLKPSVTNAEISITNYLIARQDHKDKMGGGTVIYVQDGYVTVLLVRGLAEK